MTCFSTEVRFWNGVADVGSGTLLQERRGDRIDPVRRNPIAAETARTRRRAMVSGSQIVANAEKSPARAAADGTENVRVSERRMRCPS